MKIQPIVRRIGKRREVAEETKQMKKKKRRRSNNRGLGPLPTKTFTAVI